MDYNSLLVSQIQGVGHAKTLYEGIGNLDPNDQVNNELNMRLVSCLQSIDTSCFIVNSRPGYTNIDGSMAEIDNTFNQMDETELRRQKEKMKGQAKNKKSVKKLSNKDATSNIGIGISDY